MQKRNLRQENQPSRRPSLLAGTIALLGACLTASGPAAADVTLTYKQSNSDAQAFEINIKPPRMRMDESSGMWMLYDSSIDTMFAVDPNRKSYTRINRDRAAMMGNMAGAVDAQMQEMMKNMTPEQRAMMEQAMGRSMPKQPREITYKETGETRTVNRRECQVSQLWADDELEHEFCIAKAKTVGVPEQDYAVMEKMYLLMSELRKVAGKYFNRTLPDPKDMDGVAIESRSADGAHHVLDDVSHNKLDAARFKLPPDYEEEAIPKAP